MAMKVRFAQIEPTTRCNYTCGFCVGRHMPQQDLSLDTFRLFIEQAEGLEAIELQGEGEPLLHPDFFTMIRVAREKFPDVEISMISNGSMFTHEIVEQILDHRIARIYISMESAKDEDFQRIRGGKLDRVRRGIRQLLERRRERDMTHPLLGLSVTILRSTVLELRKQIPAFYDEMHLDGGINLQMLQSMPQYRNIYNDAMANEIGDAETREIIDYSTATCTPLQQALVTRQQQAATGFYEQLMNSTDIQRECPWLANGLYMATSGQLMPCCHAKDYEADALGNIKHDPAAAANRRQEMQQQLRQGQIPEPCKGCSIAEAIASHAAKEPAATTVRADHAR